MISRYAGLAFVAIAVAACSDAPMAPRATSDLTPSLTQGVASPNTPVTATVIVNIGGETYYAGSGPSRNGLGECRTHTDGSVGWYWVPGNIQAGGKGKGGGASTGDQEVGPNHAQCRFSNGGSQVVVTFSDNATYVNATNGNSALNFDPHCVPALNPSDPPVCDDRWVHYQKIQDLTQGFGMLYGIGVRSDDHSISNWTIDLSQINSSTNLISPTRSLLLMAHNVEGLYPDSPATISW